MSHNPPYAFIALYCDKSSKYLIFTVFFALLLFVSVHVDETQFSWSNLKIQTVEKLYFDFKSPDNEGSPKDSDTNRVTTIDVARGETPGLFLITPTKPRLAQKADLTRLAQTLNLVPNLHWIVIEDSNQTSARIRALLDRTKGSYTHLNVLKDPAIRGRGMSQRNLGLTWLRQKYGNSSDVSAVVYFADDDNIYDVRLFEKIRKIQNVGIFPVGFTGGSWLESPIVKNNTVTGFDVAYSSGRKFATDMAGFAVNLNRILSYHSVLFHNRCRPGEFEDCFLSQLLNKASELEPVAMDFRVKERKEVFVYHISTSNPKVTGSSYGYDV